MEIILTAMDEGLAGAWERFCGDLPGVCLYRGSILDLTCDVIISPANSFGFMDGGIDTLLSRGTLPGKCECPVFKGFSRLRARVKGS